MPAIKSFRALLYNPRKVVLDDVVAPPYDVISPPQQDELYERSPYNSIRLILGREENRYESAARLFGAWIHDRVIVVDNRPAIYVISQRFQLAGGTMLERFGFTAACKLTEIGRGLVYPHEKTHAKPKEDRLRLFEATGAMFSQVFAIYADPERHVDRHLESVMQNPPIGEAEFDGVRNRLWRIDDQRIVFAIEEYIQRQRAFVADGHHRYETALLYSNSRRLKNPHHTGKEPYNFVPMFFANMSNPGLVILPTHRLIHSVPEFDPARFLGQLRRSFEITPFESMGALLNALTNEREHAFGLALPGSAAYSLLRTKDSALQEIKHLPSILAALDVTILHALVLRNILHLSEDAEEEQRFLDYEHDGERAVRAVRDGKAQAAFLLNPTRAEQVRAVAEAGLAMPQKSTYFFPKLLSGLVMYSFIDQ